MQTKDVLNTLERLESVGVSVWLDGGWGVDALVGAQTRRHDDLDMALDVDDLPRARQALDSAGFRHDRDAGPGLPA
jgi:lincosamide nucleotidyltransferase A/C/D/E